MKVIREFCRIAVRTREHAGRTTLNNGSNLGAEMINGISADQLEQLERLPRSYALGGGKGNGIPHGNGITQSQLGRISITVMPLVAARDEERFPMKRAWMVSVWMLPVSRENPSGIARRRDHEETCPGCRTMITTPWIIFVLAGPAELLVG